MSELISSSWCRRCCLSDCSCRAAACATAIFICNERGAEHSERGQQACRRPQRQTMASSIAANQLKRRAYPLVGVLDSVNHSLCATQLNESAAVRFSRRRKQVHAWLRSCSVRRSRSSNDLRDSKLPASIQATMCDFWNEEGARAHELRCVAAACGRCPAQTAACAALGVFKYHPSIHELRPSRSRVVATKRLTVLLGGLEAALLFVQGGLHRVELLGKQLATPVQILNCDLCKQRLPLSLKATPSQIEDSSPCVRIWLTSCPYRSSPSW